MAPSAVGGGLGRLRAGQTKASQAHHMPFILHSFQTEAVGLVALATLVRAQIKAPGRMDQRPGARSFAKRKNTLPSKLVR